MKERRWGDHPYRLLLIAVSFFLVFVGILTLLFALQTAALLNQQGEKSEAAPSTVYAAALEIDPGLRVSPAWLVDHLRRLEYRQTNDPEPRNAEYSIRKDGVVLKSPNSSFSVLVRFRGNEIHSLIRLQDNEKLQKYELDPVVLGSILDSRSHKRTAVPYDHFPSHLIQAVLAIEDRRYYSHQGVDGIAILRAAWNNLRTRSCTQGGSTITQQLVRNLYLTREKSVNRKVKEAFLAVLLERKWGKQKILERYLNEVYMGQQGSVSVYGMAEASRLYFHKDVRRLNFSEAALLAGMIQAPNTYDPQEHPDRALQRRNTVLLAMTKTSRITSFQYAMYSRAALEVHPVRNQDRQAPYFLDFVTRELQAAISSETINHGNLHVHTTLDLDLQELGERALADGLARIDKYRFKKIGKRVQGCLIAVELATGHVKAYIGGRDYSKSQFDRLSQAFRQPGSAFKPFVYAAAMEGVHQSPQLLFSPATLLKDEPADPEGGIETYEPENSDGTYHGTVSARKALALSMNVATMNLARELGISRIVSISRDFGFQNVKPYPSVPMGTVEVTPLQLIRAYTAFPNSGYRTDLLAITSVLGPAREALHQNKTSHQEVLHPQTAFLITDMLKSVMTSGTGAGAGRWGFTGIAAGKTGTTDNYRDAWFIGFTPDLMCLVWTGYDDNTSLRMYGAEAAMPIWADFMRKATARTSAKDFKAPEGIVRRWIDPKTGMLATQFCQEIVPEIFVNGTEPTELCDHDSQNPIQHF